MPDIGTSTALQASRLLEEELMDHPDIDRTKARRILSLMQDPPLEITLSPVPGVLVAAAIVLAVADHSPERVLEWFAAASFALCWATVFFCWGVPRLGARQSELRRFNRDSPAVYHLVEHVMGRVLEF